MNEVGARPFAQGGERARERERAPRNRAGDKILGGINGVEASWHALSFFIVIF